ncbi:MAG: serine hydrolase domain-containing protein [Spirochaetota bacterium]
MALRYPPETEIDRLAETSRFSGAIRLDLGSQSLSAAYGFANRAERLPNASGTRFGIASGTKFITALAIGALIDQGRLTPGTPVVDCLAERIDWLSPDATVGHLLSHTSGVWDYYDEELVTDFDNFHVETPWSFLTTPRDYLPLFHGRTMKFEPGARFSYSNGGYILLGVVVEDLSGTLFREFVAENVLAPACMERSGFFALNALPSGTALGYLGSPGSSGGETTNVYQLPKIGASDGGMFTTVDDVSRLWSAFVSDAIVSRPTRELMTRRHATIRDGLDYGYGLYLPRSGRGDAYRIVGGDAGVGFFSQHEPESGLTITVVSNESEGEEEMVGRLRELLGI